MKPRSIALAVLALAGVAQPSQAQAPEYQGLTGGMVAGAARWRLSDGLHAWHAAGGLFAGYRFHVADINGAAVSLTPRIAIEMTKFTGIPLNSTQVAFSRLDFPSVQLAVRAGSVRPYILADRGHVSIERYVGPDLLNYSGNGTAWGVGIELPRKNPCGAGFDIAARQTSARFTSAEWRGDGVPPDGGSIRATIVTIGWSGRFRGSRLLFDCH